MIHDRVIALRYMHFGVSILLSDVGVLFGSKAVVGLSRE